MAHYLYTILYIYIYITDFSFKAKIRFALPLSDLRGGWPYICLFKPPSHAVVRSNM